MHLKVLHCEVSVVVNHSLRTTSSNRVTEREISYSNILMMCCNLHISSLQTTSICIQQCTLFYHYKQKARIPLYAHSNFLEMPGMFPVFPSKSMGQIPFWYKSEQLQQLQRNYINSQQQKISSSCLCSFTVSLLGGSWATLSICWEKRQRKKLDMGILVLCTLLCKFLRNPSL